VVSSAGLSRPKLLIETLVPQKRNREKKEEEEEKGRKKVLHAGVEGPCVRRPEN
jgi:hypothetical protein